MAKRVTKVAAAASAAAPEPSPAPAAAPEPAAAPSDEPAPAPEPEKRGGMSPERLAQLQAGIAAEEGKAAPKRRTPNISATAVEPTLAECNRLYFAEERARRGEQQEVTDAMRAAALGAVHARRERKNLRPPR